jgi:hypothetical protein
MEGFGRLCTYKYRCGEASKSLLGCWVSFLFRDIPMGIHAQCKERESRREKCMVCGRDLTNLERKEKRKTGAAGLHR